MANTVLSTLKDGALLPRNYAKKDAMFPAKRLAAKQWGVSTVLWNRLRQEHQTANWNGKMQAVLSKPCLLGSKRTFRNSGILIFWAWSRCTGWLAERSIFQERHLFLLFFLKEHVVRRIGISTAAVAWLNSSHAKCSAGTRLYQTATWSRTFEESGA